MDGDGQIGRRERVLIAGGGVAAIEAALALRELAKERLTVEIHAPRREFVYRPFAVGEPFGAARILRYDLDDLAERCGASFQLGGIASVDGDAKIASSRDGEQVPYDHLLICPGARMVWAMPGATTFWGVADEGGVGAIIHRLRAGALRQLVFTMPGGATWALPMYELALLAGAVLAKSGVADGQLTIVTPEEAPLQLFGRQVGEQMAELLSERGIALVAGAHPVSFGDGELRVAPGAAIETEAVISLPRIEGRRIAGVPADEDGFLAVDEHCRLPDLEGAFAAGDVTSFPVKQGGIATQQADVAAGAIAAAAGAEVDAEAFDPVLRAVLWTGDGRRYLYGRLSGGQGETSALTDSPPWEEPDGKVVGRRLGPFLTDIPDTSERTLGAA